MPTDEPGGAVEVARAKVNLNLHVVGRDAEGYHLLETLMAFADGAQDTLRLRDGAGEDRISLGGPFAGDCGPAKDNLVLRAGHRVREAWPDLAPLAWHLDKNLPVAGGIGGGSADAGAALRLLGHRHGVPTDVLGDAARSLGADVPACFANRAAWATGRGEILEPCDIPPLPAVLVNAGTACPTPPVFGAYKKAGHRFTLSRQAPDVGDLATWHDWLNGVDNDLTASAIATTPIIDTVLRALRATPGPRLARMSGSGATCFGLYASREEAEAAARRITAARPEWWVRAAVLS